jgi:hypothetical protein
MQYVVPQSGQTGGAGWGWGFVVSGYGLGACSFACGGAISAGLVLFAVREMRAKIRAKIVNRNMAKYLLINE